MWCTLHLCTSMSTCIEPTFGMDGGQHGEVSEEGKEGQEDGKEEKEVAVRQTSWRIRIVSEVRLSITESIQQTFRPDPMQMAAAFGPDFHVWTICQKIL